MRPLDRLEADIRDFWLRVVKWFSGLMTSLIGGVTAAYASFPTSVGDFLGKLPKWLIFPAAVLAFAFITSAVHRHQKIAGKDADQKPS